MTLQDKVQLQHWVAGKATYNDVARAEPVGLVDNVRFTPAAKRAYFLLWEWSAWRLGSEWQERYYRKAGPEAFHRRIARAQQWCERVRSGQF